MTTVRFVQNHPEHPDRYVFADEYGHEYHLDPTEAVPGVTPAFFENLLDCHIHVDFAVAADGSRRITRVVRTALRG
jgi:hypothetical protein